MMEERESSDTGVPIFEPVTSLSEHVSYVNGNYTAVNGGAPQAQNVSSSVSSNMSNDSMSV